MRCWRACRRWTAARRATSWQSHSATSTARPPAAAWFATCIDLSETSPAPFSVCMGWIVPYRGPGVLLIATVHSRMGRDGVHELSLTTLIRNPPSLTTAGPGAGGGCGRRAAAAAALRARGGHPGAGLPGRARRRWSRRWRTSSSPCRQRSLLLPASFPHPHMHGACPMRISKMRLHALALYYRQQGRQSTLYVLVIQC